MRVRLACKATCGRCGWTCTKGDVDMEARRHSGETGAKSSPRHPTTVECVPVR